MEICFWRQKVCPERLDIDSVSIQVVAMLSIGLKAKAVR